MRHKTQMFGPLLCRVIDELPDGETPATGVVFCHGYGASGTDLVPLSQALCQVEPRLRGNVQFLFPEATLDLGDLGMPGGKAWWPLSIQRLQAQLSSGRMEEIRENHPDGLDEAREALTFSINAWTAASGLSLDRVVIGGFSQGAMLSVETASAMTSRPAGLAILSGALIHETAWKVGLAQKRGLPVFQSHGQYDVVLPYVTGIWLKDVFEASAVDLQFLNFPGGHEIPWEILEELAVFLLRIAHTDG